MTIQRKVAIQVDTKVAGRENVDATATSLANLERQVAELGKGMGTSVADMAKWALGFVGITKAFQNASHAALEYQEDVAGNEAAIKKLRDATGGILGVFDAAKAREQLLGEEIRATTAQQEAAAKAAVQYARINNVDVAQAMDQMTFATFRDNYARDPERTAGRFHALVAKGDEKFRDVMDQLAHHPHVTDTSRWLPWFDDLGATSLAHVDFSQVPNTTIIHGTNDAIVPVAQARLLAQRLPSVWLEEWEGVAHAPHFHDAERLKEAMAA
jgi:pimeloyl-ACP methyl ester carboxylesterase